LPGATIGGIIEELGCKVFSTGDSEREVRRAAVGDLLSFVIGSDSDGAAWITIQTHLNVAAVAVLKDIPMIIVASGREPADDLIGRCEAENISLVSSEYSIFYLCVRLGQLGLEG
jgi:hypothetical protein